MIIELRFELEETRKKINWLEGEQKRWPEHHNTWWEIEDQLKTLDKLAGYLDAELRVN